MHTTFSPQRVWQLIAEDWTEKKKLFSYALLIVLGLLILVAFLWGTDSNEVYLYGQSETIVSFEAENLLFYYVVGLLGVAAFSGIAFRPLKTKEGRISWLVRPGTPLEKLTAVFLVYGIGFLLIYSVLAFGILKLSVAYMEGFTTRKGGEYSLSKMDWKYDAYREYLPIAIYIYFGVQAFFVLGTLYFRKLSFVKSTVILIVVAVGLFYLVGVVINDYFGPGARFFFTQLKVNPWSVIHSRETESLGLLSMYKAVELKGVGRKILDFLLAYSWMPFFWMVSWIRLKETEI